MITVDHVGVHATHCCPNCGCKYGDPNCPVVTKLVEPVYDCEDCSTIGTVVLVNNTPVAWFKNFNEDAREWCIKNHPEKWAIWPAHEPNGIKIHY
jgi:hypothetical protein